MTPNPKRTLFPRREAPQPAASLNIEPVSLLWPGERLPVHIRHAPWADDLGLDALVKHLSRDQQYAPFIRQTLLNLITDPAVIAWRQSVMHDFLTQPALRAVAQTVLPQLAELRQGRVDMGRRKRSLLMETSDRLGELDLYTEVVQTLHDGLMAAEIQSEALITLRDRLGALLADESFQSLCARLPEMRAPLQNVASITVGINLDYQLRPISAVLLSINDRKLGDSVSLLERLIGGRLDESGAAVGDLHNLPSDSELRPFEPFYQDLDHLLTQAAQPIARELRQYTRASTAAVTGLEFELAFFLAGAELAGRLDAKGIAHCLPQVVPVDARAAHAEGLVNVLLALQSPDAPVPSDLTLDDDGRIAILTGPNSGGKTTYLQSVGLAYALFQSGMMIPARAARLSPVDAILTHFPALETRQQGRLAEEAGRLRAIFEQAHRHSLVLLNETFSSTASGEALYLAQDILGAMRAIGLRAIFATHFVELAQHIDEVESAIEGDSRLYSLVAGIAISDDGRPLPTFHITRGMPLGRSYAQEIARRHGISLAQILDTYRKRA